MDNLGQRPYETFCENVIGNKVSVDKAAEIAPVVITVNLGYLGDRLVSKDISQCSVETKRRLIKLKDIDTD